MRPFTSAQWVEYFAANRVAWDAIRWGDGAGVTRDDIAPIVKSIQAWQLGETSEARHLRAAARRYARRVGDPDFVTAVEYFIYEEQTHGEALGKFLDAVGVPRIKYNWGDSLFRTVRSLLPSMEAWTTVVVMIETMALPFYESLRRATPSPLLRSICSQILRDEVPHLQFQYERLGAMHSRRGRVAVCLTFTAHRVLFLCIVLAIWTDHHRLFRAGGHTFRTYWARAWRKMREHWGLMRRAAAAWAATTNESPSAGANQPSAAPESPSRVGGWLH